MRLFYSDTEVTTMLGWLRRLFSNGWFLLAFFLVLPYLSQAKLHSHESFSTDHGTILIAITFGFNWLRHKIIDAMTKISRQVSP